MVISHYAKSLRPSQSVLALRELARFPSTRRQADPHPPSTPHPRPSPRPHPHPHNKHHLHQGVILILPSHDRYADRRKGSTDQRRKMEPRPGSGHTIGPDQTQKRSGSGHREGPASHAPCVTPTRDSISGFRGESSRP